MEERELKYPIKAQIEKIHPDLRAGVRQKIMAALKISRTTLSEYENLDTSDARMIPADYLVSIANILNCRTEDLLPKLQTS